MESRRLCGEFLDKLASGVDIDAAKLKAGARIEPGAFTVNELCLAFMRHAVPMACRTYSQSGKELLVDCQRR